jgi:hypothetical protein
MSIIFTDTQLMLLSAASQRDDHCLVPPTGPKRGQAQKAIVKLLEAGIVKEIKAKTGAPIWRRDDETNHTYALKLTAAGAKAIAVGEAGALTLPERTGFRLEREHVCGGPRAIGRRGWTFAPAIASLRGSRQ